MVRFQRDAIILHLPDVASSCHEHDEYTSQGILGGASRISGPYTRQAQICFFRASSNVLTSRSRWWGRAWPFESLHPSNLDGTREQLARGGGREARQALPALRCNRRHEYRRVGIILITFFTRDVS
jgi:hypothetical protein